MGKDTITSRDRRVISLVIEAEQMDDSALENVLVTLELE